MHPISGSELSHTYEVPKGNELSLVADWYDVTIRTPEGVSLRGIYIEDEEVGTKISSIRVGKSPDLKECNIAGTLSPDNIFERFDIIASNPQLYSSFIDLRINKENFNFDDFNNLSQPDRILSFEIATKIPVNLENLKLKELVTYIDLPYDAGEYPAISIKNSDINKVIIGSYPDNNPHNPKYKSIDLTGLNTEWLYLTGEIKEDIRLDKMTKCTHFFGWHYLDCLGKIYFSETHESVNITSDSSDATNHIEEIDVTLCKDIKELFIAGLKNLKTLKYNQTDILKIVRLTGSDYIEDIELQ